MSGLPRVSGQDCVKALVAGGFSVLRQHGSHVILRRQQPFTQLVVPDDSELDCGTPRAIIRQAGMTLDQFRELL